VEEANVRVESAIDDVASNIHLAVPRVKAGRMMSGKVPMSLAMATA